MKKIFVFTSIALLTANVWASDKFVGVGNEMDHSILSEHGPGEKAHALQKGKGEMYGSIDIPQPADHSHMATDNTMQKGEGETYGSINIPQPADHTHKAQH